MKKSTIPVGILAIAAPLSALAQGGVTDLASFLGLVKSFVNALIPFLIGLALLVFLWGIFKYIASGEDEKKRGDARSLMINGIIAIFVMVSVWGLVNVLASTLGLDESPIEGPGLQPLPPINTSGGGSSGGSTSSGGFNMPAGPGVPGT